MFNKLQDAEKQALAHAAAKARLSAYAPYSKFLVGAALLANDGTIITGCNVENASFGATCCAERTAIFKAVSSGIKEFKAIAVSLLGGGTPCGICRQVINEFHPNLPVIYADEAGNVLGESTLGLLLPDAFGPHNLEKV